MINKDLIQQAKNIDLPNFLQQNGFSLVKNGINSYTTKEHNSLVISLSNGIWIYYWNSNSQGGDSIKFVQEYFEVDFKKAIEILTNQEISIKKELATRPREQILNIKEFQIPEFDKNMKRTFAYLTKTRLIDYSIIQKLVTDKLIFQDMNCNAVFPYYSNNKIVGTEKHGTNTFKRFKGVSACSDFNIGFNIQIGKNPNKIIFFESAIDLMSYIELFDPQNAILVSMSGQRYETILYYQNCHRNSLEFILAIDNHESSDEFIVKNNLTNFKREIPQTKDWNEDLKTSKKQWNTNKN